MNKMLLKKYNIKCICMLYKIYNSLFNDKVVKIGSAVWARLNISPPLLKIDQTDCIITLHHMVFFSL